MEETTVFDILKTVAFWLSPLVFLEGILLLVLKVDGYTKLENYLAKELGGIRKKVIPKLEVNIYALQNWLLKKAFIVGILFIIYAVVIFIVLRK